MGSARCSIATLLVGSAVLFLGNGLQITLLPLRAQLESFPTTVIGLMGTAYFAGFAIGCVVGPRLVQAVGHIRCFAGFAALAAAVALSYPLLLSPPAWCLLRGVTGVCFALLYMVVESWLNDQASNEVRGTVLSLYIVVASLVTVGGQLMLNLSDPLGPMPFSLVAILICLSVLPLSLTPTAVPRPVAVSRLRIARLYRVSPAGFVGCLAVGLVEGAFWSLGPVFAQGHGFSIAEVTLFMSAVVLGGAASQWPLGFLSDRIDRRRVILGCSTAAALSGVAIALLVRDGGSLALLLAGLHGACLMPVYALCLAHANDFAAPEALVETSSGLLLVYGVGAILGPLATAPLMERLGGDALFLVIAAVFALLALFVLYRLLRRGVPSVERAEFVPVPRTSPSVYALEREARRE